MFTRALPVALVVALPLLAPAGALATPGQVNPSFSSGGFNNTASNKVQFLSDGDLVVGGFFANYGGSGGISNLVRLNPDGTRDPTLGTQGTGFEFPRSVQDFEVTPTGKIWAAGDFQSFNGSSNNSALGLVLLNEDGTRDSSFTTEPNGFTGALADDVWAVTQLAGGDVLAGGIFDAYNGNPTGGLVLLNPDGTIDSTWLASTAAGGADGMVRDIDVCSNGKIMVAGDFTTFNGSSDYNRVLRLNADGTLDTGFKAVGSGVSGGGVDSVECLRDSRAVIGGGFTNYNGVTRLGVMRLEADGSLDTSFDTNPGPDANVLAIEALPSGKVAIGGLFGNVAGQPRSRLAQLNADGSLDSSFAVGTGVCSGSAPTPCLSGTPRVNGLAADLSGNLMVSGEMRFYNGASAEQLVLLYDSSRLPVSVTGSGTVTSSPAGISCPGNCSAYFDHQQQVTLTATPASGHLFSSWSGGCSGTGACTVSAGGVSVGAKFTAKPPPPPPPSKPSLSVSSIKSKVTPRGAYITSRVKVSGAGKISQRATTGTTKLTTRCTASKTTTAAATHTLKCNLGSKGRKALRKSSLRLTLRTSFKPAGKPTLSANRKLTIKRKR